MKGTDSYGVVYVLTNEAMPDIVKIGKTQNLKQRLGILNTSVPLPFKVEYVCKSKNYHDIEKALHKAFAPERINPKREFFTTEPGRVIAILEVFNKAFNGEDITKEAVEEANAELTAEEKESQEKFRKRRPTLNFKEMGIVPGTVLSYINDPTIEVTVVDERRVKYQNEVVYLTPITTQLLGKEKDVQPSPYWNINGKNLKDIYEESYGITVED